MQIPSVPPGSGDHPICLTVITSRDLERSKQFYSDVFGWQLMPISAEACACMTTAQQAAALRTDLPEKFPAVVPFIRVDDIDAMMQAALDGGFSVEKPKWTAPVGEVVRMTARSGVVYGFIKPSMDIVPKTALPSPLGSGPKPLAGSICAYEFYSGSFEFAAQFVKEHFGWGTLETMPSYMSFDTGAGASGIFQSHTPSIPALAYIYADEVAAKLGEIEAGGGKRLAEPMAMPGMGTFGYFNDPTGTAMGLIGPS